MTTHDPLIIAGKEFRSRLIAGTGKYRTMDEMRDAIDASGAEMVTVAIRRLPLDKPDEPNLMDYLDWDRYTILPNTAGCKTAEEALFTARLARELTGSTWLKLEVIPDPQYLLPDPIATLEAAQRLIDEGFTVLPYIHADPVLARRLEEIGCATVMPLGSPIGSGRGIFTREEIEIIIENANRPGRRRRRPRRALRCLPRARDRRRRGAREHRDRPGAGPGGDGRSLPPRRRGRARKAYLAGRIARKDLAQASSPLEGMARPV